MLNHAEAGTAVKPLCREHGLSTATLYSWMSHFSGMAASLLGRMEVSEEQNRRLKMLYIQATQRGDRVERERLPLPSATEREKPV